jgi:hypothetical protein
MSHQKRITQAAPFCNRSQSVRPHETFCGRAKNAIQRRTTFREPFQRWTLFFRDALKVAGVLAS